MLFCGVHAAEQLIKIPFKQDPPISIDGDIADWRDVKCGVIALDGKKDLLKYGNIKNPPEKKDFSGKLYFCWKPQGLFVAAEVLDDKFIQTASGRKCYQGDHVELFIDPVPLDKTGGAKFGKKQFHILISPGDFKNLKPEVAVSHPEGVTLPQAVCAASSDNLKWVVEAFIPWQALGGKAVKTNDIIALGAWLCDTDAVDGNAPKNEHILTSGKAAAKFRDRSSLTPAVFTDANGSHTAKVPLRVINVKDALSIKPGELVRIAVDVPVLSDYLVPLLRFNGNLRSKNTFSGYSRSLQVFVNGHTLMPERMLAPENEFRNTRGMTDTVYLRGRGYMLPYTNDGKSGNLVKNTLKMFASHFNMHEFAFDLSGMLKPGKNFITFKSSHPVKLTHLLEITAAHISFEDVPRRQLRRAAPTGKIPVIVPRGIIPLSKNVKITGTTQITAGSGKDRFVINSSYSTPDGKWVRGSNRFFKFGRKIERKAELLVVTDIFTNLTKENLPLMQNHMITVPGGKSILKLAGITNSSGKEIRRTIGNFSVFGGVPGRGGVGLYALDPVFQVHFGAFIPSAHNAVMCDDQLVIPPGKTVRQQFAVVPLEQGDYYDFVNVIRRYINAGKTLPGVNGTVSSAKWMDEFHKRVIPYHIDYAVVSGNSIGRGFFDEAVNARSKEVIKKLRAIKPGIKILRYYHSQIESDAKNPWKGGELLLKNGRQARYGANSLIYLNIEGTPFNRMMESVLDDTLKNWDVDGIYWDEFASCSLEFHYGRPWDSCSADIDLKTHKIKTLKSSVWLLQKQWKKRMAEKIRKAGKILTTNGGDAMMGGFDKDILFTFTETQYAANCARVHFSTPVAHANHEHMDRNRPDEFYLKFLENLDYGCLPAYSFISQPHTGVVYPTVTDHAYPSTPLEINAGYVIAAERIITKVSGSFGWNDASKHTVYVYDHTGREVKKHNMKTVASDGKVFTEIRLPMNWSAVIVRN